MSERKTGATDAQIEAGAKRYYTVYENTDPEEYREWDQVGRRERAVFEEIAEEILSAAYPPDTVVIERGKIIRHACDLTDDEAETFRDAVANEIFMSGGDDEKMGHAHPVTFRDHTLGSWMVENGLALVRVADFDPIQPKTAERDTTEGE